MEFIKAGMEHIDRMCEITEDAKRQLRGLGLDQWQNFPPTAQDTAAHFARGELYVVREGNMIAGTFVLVPCEPAYDRIEGAWLQSGRYVALHRVAVSPISAAAGWLQRFFAPPARMRAPSGQSRCAWIRTRATFPCARHWKRTDLRIAARS